MVAMIASFVLVVSGLIQMSSAAVQDAQTLVAVENAHDILTQKMIKT